MRSFHTWPSYIACVAILGCSLIGCGDDSTSSTGDGGGTLGVGESCEDASACQTGLLCVGTICQDPNTASNGDTTGTSNGTTGGTTGGTTATSNGTTSTSNGTTGTTGGTTSTSNGTTGTSNGTTGTSNGTTGTSNGTTGSPRPETLTGGVSIFEAQVVANALINIRRGNAGAAFVVPGDGDEDPITTIGPCDIIQVRVDPPAPFGYDAGTIEVTGTSPAATLTPSRSGSGSVAYNSNLSEDNANIYSPGATLTITASGGDHIDAFSGTIAAPNEHRMTSPAPDDTIGGDTQVVWSPAQSGLEIVINAVPLDALFMPVNGPGLSCVVPSDAGSFTIPAAALDALQGPRLALTVIKVDNQSITVGPDTVILNTTYAHGAVVTLN